MDGNRRLIALVPGLLAVLAIFFSQYVAWTPVANAWVEGPQGRYFLPVTPLLILVFRRPRWFPNVPHTQSYFVGAVGLISGLVTIRSLVQGSYVTGTATFEKIVGYLFP